MRVLEMERVSGVDGEGREDRVETDAGDRNRGRRLFMAGRVDGQVQQVKFAPFVRAPIQGPWSLALVVRSA